MKKVDIIIPVYDGYVETIQCIESVLASNLDTKTKIFLNVINDCSPNGQLTDWLREASKKYQFSLYENEKNLGFVQTVNRGMDLHQDRDVILLNSDTIVAGDWVQRMTAHVGRDAKISSVTPFSNNATICSFPNFCEENELLPHSVSLIDEAFSKANVGESLEIPTAIGFCMYITRSSMNDVGYFDADTFGRGYGEENDFCMRTMRSGWKHIVAADVFVAHIGGVSFSDEKAERCEAAQKIIDRLYPDYTQLVQDFISKDPLIEYRIKAYAELIRLSSKKTMLLISHNLGGGVEKYIQELEKFWLNEGFLPILRPGCLEGEVEFSFSPQAKDKISFFIPKDYDKLLRLCASLGVGRVYIQHTMGMRPEIINIVKDLDCFMDFMLHDYYLVNANPTLTSKEGRFCDVFETRDELCSQHYEIPFGISAKEWREGQKFFLNQCNRILAPSQYTAQLFKQYFQNHGVEVIYHPDSLHCEYPEPRPIKMVTKVLVLGAISKEKGADILEATALLAKTENRKFQFHLLGYAYRPLNGVIEHGAYNDGDVDEKITSINPDIIWFPALCPETYSFTLSEAMRSAKPILASNLGAFPERLKGRPYSSVVHWKNSPKDWLSCLDSFISQQESCGENSEQWQELYEDSKNFYQSYWDHVQNKLCHDFDIKALVLKKDMGYLTKKERKLMLLVKLRNMRGGRWISRILPMSLQQQVKRYFSEKPLHDLLGKK